MRLGIIALLIACAFPAHAQYMGTLPPNLEAGFNYTTDSDKFSTNQVFVGGSIDNGIGIRYGVGRGSGKDFTAVTGGAVGASGTVFGNGDSIITSSVYSVVGKVSTTYDTQTIQATYVNVGENHDFHGAIGIKQIRSAVNGNILITERNTTTTTIQPTPPSTTTSTASTSYPVSRSDNQDVIVGDAELKLTMTDSLTVGIMVSRDVVESAGNTTRAAIAGYSTTVGVDTITAPTSTIIIADTAAIDMDLQLSDNLSSYVQVGITHFSNDNNRSFVNTKTTYGIVPTQGLSVYVRTKYQHDDAPTAGNICTDVGSAWACVTAPYLSPDARYSVIPGIQIRQVHQGLVYTGAVELGKQWTLVSGDKTSDYIYGWQLGVQTQPGKRSGTTFGANLFGTNSSMVSTSDKYHWHGFYSWVKVPF